MRYKREERHHKPFLFFSHQGGNVIESLIPDWKSATTGVSPRPPTPAWCSCLYC